jgi:hypothetical protein
VRPLAAFIASARAPRASSSSRTSTQPAADAQVPQPLHTSLHSPLHIVRKYEALRLRQGARSSPELRGSR